MTGAARPARVGRPLGEVSLALLSAAQRGPATARELAARACVGYDVARWKASDLVRMGALQPLGADRPRVLGLPQVVAPAAVAAEDAFALLARSFWERPDPADA